jgi:hypothetical protein
MAEELKRLVLIHPETCPITQEQLVAEVKRIYAGLVMVEAKCIEVETAKIDAVATANSTLLPQQWQAPISLQRTLLHEHHDFFLASQHPKASPALRRLASKFAMPASVLRRRNHEQLRHCRSHHNLGNPVSDDLNDSPSFATASPLLRTPDFSRASRSHDITINFQQRDLWRQLRVSNRSPLLSDDYAIRGLLLADYNPPECLLEAKGERNLARTGASGVRTQLMILSMMVLNMAISIASDAGCWLFPRLAFNDMSGIAPSRTRRQNHRKNGKVPAILSAFSIGLLSCVMTKPVLAAGPSQAVRIGAWVTGPLGAVGGYELLVIPPGKDNATNLLYVTSHTVLTHVTMTVPGLTHSLFSNSISASSLFLSIIFTWLLGGFLRPSIRHVYYTLTLTFTIIVCIGATLSSGARPEVLHPWADFVPLALIMGTILTYLFITVVGDGPPFSVGVDAPAAQ